MVLWLLACATSPPKLVVLLEFDEIDASGAQSASGLLTMTPTALRREGCLPPSSPEEFSWNGVAGDGSPAEGFTRGNLCLSGLFCDGWECDLPEVGWDEMDPDLDVALQGPTGREDFLVELEFPEPQLVLVEPSDGVLVPGETVVFDVGFEVREAWADSDRTIPEWVTTESCSFGRWQVTGSQISATLPDWVQDTCHTAWLDVRFEPGLVECDFFESCWPSAGYHFEPVEFTIRGE
jgi:hypothetical protein